MKVALVKLKKLLEDNFVVITSGIRTTIYVTKVVDDGTTATMGFHRLAGDTLGRLECVRLQKEGSLVVFPFEYEVLDVVSQNTLKGMYL
jgi:hypothetical protein